MKRLESVLASGKFNFLENDADSELDVDQANLIQQYLGKFVKVRGLYSDVYVTSTLKGTVYAFTFDTVNIKDSCQMDSTFIKALNKIAPRAITFSVGGFSLHL